MVMTTTMIMMMMMMIVVSVEKLVERKLTGKTKVPGDFLPQWHLTHHKTHAT
jgi:hypothetical protein